MRYIRIIVVVALAFVGQIVPAGAQIQNVLDGAYVREHNPTRRVIPYPYLREADVMWAQRIWQVIDLREKANHPLYFPIERIEDRKSLFDCIKDALMKDLSITAYDLGPAGDDDEFLWPMTLTELDSLLNPTVTRYTVDPDTGEEIPVTQAEPIESRAITQFQIKEDWLFDKQRSERYVRIIGIAPMMESYDDEGVKRGYKTLFWIYFPELRYVLANQDIFNRHNDALQMSFEDFFQKRMFQGYVVKETNVYDRNIMSYSKGIDALLESERIKEELFLFEHDLWHY